MNSTQFMLFVLALVTYLFVPIDVTYRATLVATLLGIIAYSIFKERKNTQVEEYVEEPEQIFTPDIEIVEEEEPEAPIVNIFKPFIIPTNFLKKSKILYDTDEYLSNMADRIVSAYKGFSVKLEYVEPIKTAQFNMLQFRVLPETMIVKGKEIQKQTSTATISKYIVDIRRVLGDIPVQFQSSIPGTSYVGFTVPSSQENKILFGNLIHNLPVEFNNKGLPNNLPFPYGMTQTGEMFGELTKAPHILVAGASNSGKSSFINALILSLLMVHTDETLELWLADGKSVELSRYNGIPQLKQSAITDSEKLLETLDSLVKIMDHREEQFVSKKVREIKDWNNKYSVMSFIVFVIDEYGDMMLRDKKISGLIEHSIIRLAQKGRAFGIHVVLTTQRPDSQIVTGQIKANLVTKVALKTATRTDSRIIIDSSEAADLNGNGDALLSDNKGLTRFQGLYVSDNESEKIIKEINKYGHKGGNNGQH